MTWASSDAGGLDPPAANGFVEAGDAWLNLALNLPNVKGTSPNFDLTGELPPQVHHMDGPGVGRNRSGRR
jgi:hypothetical protein